MSPHARATVWRGASSATRRSPGRARSASSSRPAFGGGRSSPCCSRRCSAPCAGGSAAAPSKVYYFPRGRDSPADCSWRREACARRVAEEARPAALPFQNKGGTDVLYWALIFLLVAVVAAVFGFGNIAAAATGIAKVIFFLFLVFFVIALVAGLLGRSPTP